LKVKLFKENTEAKVMQAICPDCWNKHIDLGTIFPSYNAPKCGKSWSCLYCGHKTIYLGTRNCKVIEVENMFT